MPLASMYCIGDCEEGVPFMTNAFYTTLASKAIIVERETGMRLFWFWPLAALMLIISTSVLFRDQPIVTLTVLLVFVQIYQVESHFY